MSGPETNIGQAELPGWQLVRIGERDTPTDYGPLSSRQAERIPDYVEALGVAVTSRVADPIYSNYFVKEGIGPVGQPKYPAGNIEYGHLQGVHGEEAAVVVFKVNYPDYRGPVVLALVAGEEGNLATPCGNCRDVLQTINRDDPRQLEIVSGAETGGLAIVASFQDYLFEAYQRLDGIKELGGLAINPQQVLHNVNIALGLMEHQDGMPPDLDPPRPYDPYAPEDYQYPEQAYSAGLVSSHGFMWIGERLVVADYHPTYPIESAIIKADRDYAMDHVVIVSSTPDGQPPRVMYRDRQRLYEHNQRQSDLRQQELDPPVLLVNNYEPANPQIWVTSAKEWLPLPFSADNFDSGFRQEIADYNRQLGVYHSGGFRPVGDQSSNS